MRTMAVINGDTVENVILAEENYTLPGRILVDVTDLAERPGPGWSWDGETFIAPVIPQRPWVKTRHEFRQLFTLDERQEIDAVNDFSTGPPVITGQARKQVRTFLKDLELSDRVEQANIELMPGLQLLESVGLLGAGRAAQIYAGENPPVS